MPRSEERTLVLAIQQFISNEYALERQHCRAELCQKGDQALLRLLRGM